jgi:hypothetical protein
MTNNMKITFSDKTYLNQNANIPDNQKVTNDNINEIKNVVNTNDTNVGDTSTLKTTSKNVVGAINEVYNNNIFSTSETIIGKWINGKFIYRKVIDFGALPNNARITVNHNISNIDIFTNIYGVASTANNAYSYPLPVIYRGPESNYNVEILISKAYIEMASAEDRSAITAYVVLEYTKTS